MRRQKIIFRRNMHPFLASESGKRYSANGSYLTLGVMLWPYMIPYAITVANAAAPDASLQFLFYGVVVVLPVIVVYTIGVYWVFRGKVRRGYSWTFVVW
ncbi:MAG: cytochrome d ubiquinol oxidase subunit II [Methylococcales bacterium]|nr:cytochrome d ubiquinol oxidase subunit II [Methylococcales bacterium]